MMKRNNWIGIGIGVGALIFAWGCTNDKDSEGLEVEVAGKEAASLGKLDQSKPTFSSIPAPEMRSPAFPTVTTTKIAGDRGNPAKATRPTRPASPVRGSKPATSPSQSASVPTISPGADTAYSHGQVRTLSERSKPLASSSKNGNRGQRARAGKQSDVRPKRGNASPDLPAAVPFWAGARAGNGGVNGYRGLGANARGGIPAQPGPEGLADYEDRNVPGENDDHDNDGHDNDDHGNDDPNDEFGDAAEQLKNREFRRIAREYGVDAEQLIADQGLQKLAESDIDLAGLEEQVRDRLSPEQLELADREKATRNAWWGITVSRMLAQQDEGEARGSIGGTGLQEGSIGGTGRTVGFGELVGGQGSIGGTGLTEGSIGGTGVTDGSIGGTGVTEPIGDLVGGQGSIGGTGRTEIPTNPEDGTFRQPAYNLSGRPAPQHLTPKNK